MNPKSTTEPTSHASRSRGAKSEGERTASTTRSSRSSAGKSEEERYQASRARAQAKVEATQKELQRVSDPKSGVGHFDKQIAAYTRAKAQLQAVETRHANATTGKSTTKAASTGKGSRGSSSRSKSSTDNEIAKLEARLATLKAGRSGEGTGSKGGTSRGSKSGREAKPLTPVHTVNPKLFGPDKGLNPYLLHYSYGAHQIRAALNRYTSNDLIKVARSMNAEAGVKGGRMSRESAIEHIVTHLSHLTDAEIQARAGVEGGEGA